MTCEIVEFRAGSTLPVPVGAGRVVEHRLLTPDERKFLAFAREQPDFAEFLLHWFGFKSTGDDRTDGIVGGRLAVLFLNSVTINSAPRALAQLVDTMPRPLSAMVEGFLHMLAVAAFDGRARAADYQEVVERNNPEAHPALSRLDAGGGAGFGPRPRRR